MYSVGQERRLVDPPSQVVAGVRTVTTNMDGRDALPRMSRPFALLATATSTPHAAARNFHKSKRSQERNQYRSRHQAGPGTTALVYAAAASTPGRHHLDRKSPRLNS